MIERKEYMDWLKRWQGQQLIKVVSGVRRCGKSTMFSMFKNELLKQGVTKEQIISINFEDIDYEDLTDYRTLYAYIKERLLADKMNYIFLDEIQHVVNFEKTVDSLFIKNNCDVYITGSNAYFMSGELATLLSGRYVELKMLPLSFKEFCGGLDEARQALTKAQKFNLYVQNGSFPYTLRLNNSSENTEYLRDIFNSILLKDVVARLKIGDVKTLENITKVLMDSIGSGISANKIANTLKSAGKSADAKTVERYIRGLTDSLLMYEAPRYNIKGRQYLTTLSKYYTVDTGLRNLLVKKADADIGHLLENIVYLELLRRCETVCVGKNDNSEVDFVTFNGEQTAYYQVAATTIAPETLKRELSAFKNIADNHPNFKNIADNHPKYLLTLDEVFAEADYDGIKKLNVIDWLLQ